MKNDKRTAPSARLLLAYFRTLIFRPLIPFNKVAFQTLGCKLNLSETGALARQLAEAGYARVEMEERPDVVVINTCSVTEQADKKCRNLVRRAKRANSQATVVVVGCYAQLKPKEVLAIEGVDLVLGAGEKFDIVRHIEQQRLAEAPRALRANIKEAVQFHPSHTDEGERTRVFMKVQDGCDYFCSFCTIPLARGRSRSGSIAQCVAEAEQIAAKGAAEVVLTGVNIGDFGAETGESFLDLIRHLDRVEGIKRFRISSIEPNLLSNEVVDFVATSQKFVPHFHMPLQSASNVVLQAMRRRYTAELYAERVARIRSLMPDACIGADVIVGFPGETDEQFAETAAFVKSVALSYLHVFTYSERRQTTAIKLPDPVPVPVRQQRNRALTAVSDQLKKQFYQQHAATQRPVLWEASENEGLMHGFTDNYLKVAAPWNADLVNQITLEWVGQMPETVADMAAEVMT